MKMVGYLFNRQEGLEGQRGIYYDYIVASNGIFIEAKNKLLEVRIPLAYCDIRGLAPLKMKLQLTYGSIPQWFFDRSLHTFLTDTAREHYVAIIGDAGYHFHVPIQEGEGDSVSYEKGNKVVLEMHSHGQMGAWFSHQDNEDETGLKVYGVVGQLDKTPVVKLRLGVYGYYIPLAWSEVFDGNLVGATEIEEGKEVKSIYELQSFTDGTATRLPNSGCGLWWHW
ncbi:MAG: hypothetical protein KAV87_05185 [Desulfobacteraceae bacterium]|nr:hypothetical protein [Desulfobacteraceae bacterium]